MGVQFHVPVNTTTLNVTGQSTLADTTVTGLTASGDTSVVKLTASGNTNVVKLTASGDTSVVALTATGNTTLAKLTASGDTSVVKLTASGDTSVVKLTASGATTLSSTLGVTGATTLSSTLGVTGATTLSSTLNVAGNTSVVKLTASGDTSVVKLTASGDTSVVKLTASGNLTVTGDTSLGSTLGVTGPTTLGSTLNVASPTTLGSTLNVAGPTTLNSTLGVTGPTTLGSTLNVTGVTKVAKLTAAGNLIVTGVYDLLGNLTANSATSLDSTLDVTGATSLSSTLGVTGATTLGSTLNVTGVTTLGSTLNVTGATSLGSTLNVTGDLTVTGDINYNGLMNINGQTNINAVTNFNNGANFSGNVELGSNATATTQPVNNVSSESNLIATCKYVDDVFENLTGVTPDLVATINDISIALAKDENSGVSTILDKITDETSRAGVAEGVLTSAISSEKTRAITAENRLDTQKVLFPSKSIYADGTPMTLPPSDMVNKGVKGWYFKNDSPSKKINWYMPTVGMKVSDIKGLYLEMFNGSNTNTYNMPFITVYTAISGTDNASSWYKSKKSYTVLLETSAISANIHCTPFMNVSGSCTQPVLKTGSVVVNMFQNDAISLGNFAATETVSLISIGSSSNAQQDGVEFCISKFGVITTDTTQELVFADAMNGVIVSTSGGSGNLEFGARDGTSENYFMGVDASGNIDELFIKKGTAKLMSISSAGVVGNNGTDTVTFAAPVVFNGEVDISSLLDLSGPNCKIKVSSTQYVSGPDFMSFLLNSTSITKYTF